MLAPDLARPLCHIRSANDDARLILPVFWGEIEGHATPPPPPLLPAPLFAGGVLSPSSSTSTTGIVPDPAKSTLLSGGVTTGIESSEDNSDDTDTLLRFVANRLKVPRYLADGDLGGGVGGTSSSGVGCSVDTVEY